MIQFVFRRLLALPVIIFFVTLILFAMILQLPAEQRIMLYVPSVNPHLTPEQYEELVQRQIERYGIDKSLPVQYARWLGEMVSEEWGYSATWRQTVLAGLRQRAPVTLEICLYASIPAILLAVVTGSLSVRHYGRLPDHALQAASFVAWALPSFILALVLMNLFYAWLGWFPPERLSLWATPIANAPEFRAYSGLLTIDALLNGRFDLFVDALRHLVLPATTLALSVWALLTRIMRSSLLEVMRQDYITTARAKGLPEQRVISRHARRNALLPVISAGGVVTSLLITGIIVVESIFNLNGVGRWAIKAILGTDIPVAVGFAFFSCIAVVLTSLLADVLYAFVDPRIRLFKG